MTFLHRFGHSFVSLIFGSFPGHTHKPKCVALSSSRQAFPKHFCALSGIIQLDHADFLFGETSEVLRPIYLYAQLLSDLWGLHCSVPTLSGRAAFLLLFALINNLLPLLTPSFPLLCGYSVLKFPFNAELVLSSAEEICDLLSKYRIMTARACQGHCNVLFSVLACVSFRQHHSCLEME